MEIKIDKQKIESLLERVSKAIASNAANPILSGLVLEVTKTQLIAYATNGALGIKSFLSNEEVDVQIPGKVLVNGKIFRELVKQHGGVITLTSDGKTLVLVSEYFKSSVNLLVLADYPPVDFEAIGKEFTLPAETWSALVRSTVFACAENESRLILNGVNITSSEKAFAAVGTDTFRLSRITFNPLPENIHFSVTIHARQIRDLVPQTARGDIRFVVNEDRIVAFYQQTVAMSNFIVGVYPAVDERIIPQTFTSTLEIEVTELKQLITRAAAINDEGASTVILTINEQELAFESTKHNIGSARATTGKFKYDHKEAFHITFNSRFLRDAIDLITGKVLLCFNSEYTPIVVKAPGGTHLTQVIMPQRMT